MAASTWSCAAASARVTRVPVARAGQWRCDGRVRRGAGHGRTGPGANAAGTRRPRGRRAAGVLRRRSRPSAVGRGRAGRAGGPGGDHGGRGRRRGRSMGGRAPGGRVGAGRPLRPEPGARWPVRRDLAGRRRAGPAGRAAVDRPPLRLGEQRGAAPGGHRRAHAGPAGRRGRAALRRHPDGDAGRVDRNGPGAAPRAAGDRDREAGRAGRGRRPARRCGDHLGAGGGPVAGRRRGLPATAAAAGSRSGPTSPCAPSPAGGRASAPSSSPPARRPPPRQWPTRCRCGP